MNYTVRVQGPKVARKACEHFDGCVEEAVETMACVKPDDDSRTLLSSHWNGGLRADQHDGDRSLGLRGIEDSVWT
jgi:hypothetical protein